MVSKVCQKTWDDHNTTTLHSGVRVHNMRDGMTIPDSVVFDGSGLDVWELANMAISEFHELNGYINGIIVCKREMFDYRKINCPKMPQET